jgi:putative oxidoreductase
MAALGVLVLRLTLATVLAAHGAHKLFGAFSGAAVGPGGLASTAEHFQQLGLEPGLILAVLAGVIQFFGGLLIGLGLLTRPAAIAAAGYYTIEIWKDSARWGFFLNWAGDATRGHGFEFALLVIGGLVCLILAGAGEWSVDGRRARTAASRALGRSRLRSRP